MPGLKASKPRAELRLGVGQHLDADVALDCDAEGCGVRVELSGSSVDRGVIRPTGGWAVGARNSPPGDPLGIVWQRWNERWVCERPSFGFVPSASPDDPISFMHAMLSLRVELQAEAPGSSELVIAVHPMDDALEPAEVRWSIVVEPLCGPLEHLNRLGFSISRVEPFSTRIAFVAALAELALGRWGALVDTSEAKPLSLIHADLSDLWEALAEATDEGIRYVAPRVWSHPPMEPGSYELVDGYPVSTGAGPTNRQAMASVIESLVSSVLSCTIAPGDGKLVPMELAPWQEAQRVARAHIELAALAAAAPDGHGWYLADRIDELAETTEVDEAVREQAALLQFIEPAPANVDLSQPDWVDRFRPRIAR